MTALVANAYVGNRTPTVLAEWAEKSGADVGLFCELNVGTIRSLRVLGWLGTPPNPRLAGVSKRECGVWLPGWEPEGTALHQLTEKMGKKGIGSARYARTAAFEGIAAISTHANAAIHKRETGDWIPSPRTREWRFKGLPRLAELVGGYLSAGRPVLVGLDGNVTDKGEASMRPWFDSLGMDCVNAELMWFGWSREHYRLVDFEVLPTAPGADAHPVLLVTLEREESSDATD